MHSQWGEQDTDLLTTQEKSIFRLAEFVSGFVVHFWSMKLDDMAQQLEKYFRSMHSKIEFHQDITQLLEGSWTPLKKRCDCGPTNPDCVLA